jgi:hypothetical protein
MMVGGAAAAAAIIAAVVLLQNASPEPGPPNAPPVVSGPIEKPPTVATPDSAPKETPPATAPGVGVLVLDALPWAEVVDIVDAAGTRQTLPPNAATPIFLELPPGDYDITLKNGSSRSVKARVKAGEITQPAPLDFGQIDAAEYFRRLKW